MEIEVSTALNIIVWVIGATAAVMIFFGYLVNQKNRKSGQNRQNPHSTAPPKPPAATAPRHSQPKSAANQFNIQRNLPTQGERNQGITCTYTIINESNGEKWQGRFEKGGFFS
ncbi:MAG: hypothetical protein FWG68_01440, partial [Defluviitaleaceae bacterium]|nr:hypothetical protein [Defluviitaleaceae bacterium]